MEPQSFFIDSTDGKLKVFTTQSPKYPTNENPFDLHDAAYIAHGYSQALELAKKEAVEVDLDDLTTKNVLYYSGKYTISGWIVDTIYTINMEEDIKFVYQTCVSDDEWKDISEDEYNDQKEFGYQFRKVARIIPKKESKNTDEHQVHERVKSDDVAMFADDDFLLIYDHFYRKGLADAGKKAEESQDELWNEVLTLVRNLDDAEVIFVSLKKHFEIKRKA